MTIWALRKEQKELQVEAFGVEARSEAGKYNELLEAFLPEAASLAPQQQHYAYLVLSNIDCFLGSFPTIQYIYIYIMQSQLDWLDDLSHLTWGHTWKEAITTSYRQKEILRT